MWGFAQSCSEDKNISSISQNITVIFFYCIKRPKNFKVLVNLLS